MRAITPNRICVRIAILVCAALLARSASSDAKVNSDTVERWGIFELTLQGPSGGNPFIDVRLGAEFRQGERVFKPEGFYDGDGVYRIRFMPDQPGVWSYVTKSNRRELNGKKGQFTCVKPSPGNHGPVRVHKTWHLAYADGTPYFQVGTTCYAWVHQGDAMEEQTLATLKEAPFNKMRMCVFPKSYSYNKNEPQSYPFEGKPLTNWDYSRFNPAFFRHFEGRVADLRDLGIEADLILFHPYDRWGYAKMDAKTDDRYLRYVVARLAAYRNVWWSKGGVLRGQSPARIAFLKEIMEPTPFEDMIPAELAGGNRVLSKKGQLYFVYCMSSERVSLNLPGTRAYKVDSIDTWNMTITSHGSASPGTFSFAAPKPNYLLRLSVYEAGEKIRPEVKASVEPVEGIAPLKVQFASLNVSDRIHRDSEILSAE